MTKRPMRYCLGMMASVSTLALGKGAIWPVMTAIRVAEHMVTQILVLVKRLGEVAAIANEAGDWSSQWHHGTLIWSTAGGYKSGMLVGPAYKANFILWRLEIDWRSFSKPGHGVGKYRPFKRVW